MAVGFPDGYADSPTSPVILTSPDGIEWTLRDAGVVGAGQLFRVAHGNGLWVAVGAGGTILTSPDTVIWTRQASGVTFQLREIAFGAGSFVAVGGNRTVLTSSDGLEWMPPRVPSTVPALLTAVVFTGTRFVATAAGTAAALHAGGAILTSPDGVDWTVRSVPTGEALRDVAVGPGQLLAVGAAANGSTATVLTSADGISWATRLLPAASGASFNLLAATHGPRGFLVGGLDGSLFASTDGVTWQNRTLATSRRFLGVAHDGVRYCAVGDSGAVASSPDGVTWTNRTALDPSAYSSWTSVIHAAAASRFAAVGASSTAHGDFAVVRVSDAAVTEGKSSTTPLEFTVTLSPASAKTVTVQYATADGTAVAASDYVAASGTLTFLPAESTKTVVVRVNGDLLNEDDETLSLHLGNATGAAIGASSALGTIRNDDPAPSLSVGNAAAKEGGAGTTPMTFTVTLGAASGRTVAVTVATADGTATGGTAPTPAADYVTLAPTLLTFAPGEKSRTVSVSIVGDRVREPNETFFVRITSPVNATLGTAQGTGTITNDDK